MTVLHKAGNYISEGKLFLSDERIIVLAERKQDVTDGELRISLSDCVIVRNAHARAREGWPSTGVGSKLCLLMAYENRSARLQS